MKAMFSGRQSDNVHLDEDSFGARGLREGDVYEEKGRRNTNFSTDLRFQKIIPLNILPCTVLEKPKTAMALAGFLSSP